MTELGVELVERLKAFNRKERYWLICNALGEAGSEPKLSKSFRDRLSKAIGIEIPEDAWWALDYHIDWLYSALMLDGWGDPAPALRENPISQQDRATPRRLIRGNQEDFDFIIAFGRTIIVLEAKGTEAWNNAQIESKYQRLGEWQAYARQRGHEALRELVPPTIIVVLTSPRAAKKLTSRDWSAFGALDGERPLFLQLDLTGAPAKFLAPERCSAQGATASDGDHWQLREIARPELDEA